MALPSSTLMQKIEKILKAILGKRTKIIIWTDGQGLIDMTNLQSRWVEKDITYKAAVNFTDTNSYWRKVAKKLKIRY